MKKIIVISPEAWGPNFVSKHHYANVLSENHIVYFINPPKKFNNFKVSVEVEKVHDHLNIISYSNVLPKLNRLPLTIQGWVYKIIINKILKTIKKPIDIVWSFDPRRFYKQSTWGASKSIYHSVDFHPNSKEDLLCKNSDLVIGLSDLICADLEKYSTEVHKISHGCHFDLEKTSIKSRKLPGQFEIKAIYVGNIHKHIDYDILHMLATQNKVDFIIIGPTEINNLSSNNIAKEDLEKLKKLQNIHFLGSIKSNEILDYLSSAHINLVLFKKEFELIHHAPHKMMAYFASGNLIISNMINEYRNASENLLKQLEQTSIIKEFPKVITSIHEHNSDSNKHYRKSFSQENLYSKKVTEILELIK